MYALYRPDTISILYNKLIIEVKIRKNLKLKPELGQKCQSEKNLLVKPKLGKISYYEAKI